MLCRVREHITATLRGHEQEVCGLKWSPSGAQLASGGNDNVLHVWDADASRPAHRLTAHCAAVKALAWCPFQVRRKAFRFKYSVCLGCSSAHKSTPEGPELYTQCNSCRPAGPGLLQGTAPLVPCVVSQTLYARTRH